MKIKFFILLLVILFPSQVLALESGSVRETFSSIRRFNEDKTTAFVDAEMKDAVLPLRYGLRNLGVGLYEFKNASVTSIATDGTNILAATNAALALVDSNGSAMDLNSVIKGKVKAIKALGYLYSSGKWVVAGDAKTGDGPLLLVINDGNIIGDFQKEAKAAELDKIISMACGSNGCLLYGAKGYGQKRIAFFDGSSVTNVTSGVELNAGSNWKLASNGSDIFVAGAYKDKNAPVESRYITRVYKYSNGSFTKSSNDTVIKNKTDSRIGLGFTGSKFILAQGGVNQSKPFAAWEFDEASFNSITTQFERVIDKLTFEPVVGGNGASYMIGGPSLYVGMDKGINISGGQILQLAGVDVRAMISLNNKLVIAGKGGAGSMLVEVSVEGYNTAAILETDSMAGAGSSNYFKSVIIKPKQETPPGTRVDYTISGDGGLHWENIEINKKREFTNQGDDLRLRAVLASDSQLATPRISEILVDFEKSQVTTTSTVKTRDSKRVANLGSIARVIDKFKKERGVYPVVDGNTAEVRYLSLGKLLIDGDFIKEMPKDPRIDEDPNLLYDYISSRNGDRYVLVARLEDGASERLKKDVDGQPVLPFVYSYTCDDPWYCEGKGFVVEVKPSAPATFPQNTGTAEVVLDETGKMWRIAASLDGSMNKIYIPSASVVEKLRQFYSTTKKIGQAEIEKIPRARLVKTEDKADVYYITETFLKRWIPTWDIFVSYGNKAKDIVIVKTEELTEYGVANLIRLDGDSKVWVLEGGVRRYVPNPQTFEKKGFKWKNIAPVNIAEFNIYPEGKPVE